MKTDGFRTVVHRYGKRFYEEQVPSWDPQRMVPTAECPTYPEHLARQRPPLAMSELSDQRIDEAILYIMAQDPLAGPVPKTQYGRRIAVETYTRLLRTGALR